MSAPRALLALFALAGLLAAPALALGPAAPGTQAAGAGLVTGGSVLCAHVPTPSVLTAVLTQAAEDGWTVALQSPGDGPCLGLVADACPGVGRLELGIVLAGCAPFRGHGELGPFAGVAGPCEAGPCPRVLQGPVWYANALGGWSGSLVLLAQPRALA